MALKIKKTMLVTMLITVNLLFITSCDNYVLKSENEFQQLTFYYCAEKYDPLFDIIEKYNKYCTSKKDESYKIKTIEFESEDDIYLKMSTELMVGKGPDIISLSQRLPFEKLIDNGTFANINDLTVKDESDDKLNFSDYNSVIMESGIYKGGRYIIPLFYCPDIVFTSDELLKKYKIPDNFDYTYDSIGNDLTEYFREFPDVPFCGAGYGKTFFYLFIDSYVDQFNGENYFTSVEFENNLDNAVKVALNNNEDYNNYVFLTPKQSFGGGSLFGVTKTIIQQHLNGVDFKILPNFRRTDNTISAYVQCALAINNNSAYKEQALEFIKYCLSENIQKYWCGTLSVTGNSSFAGSNTIALPVNNNALNDTIDIACEPEKYIESYDESISNIANKTIEDYVEIINSINYCSIYNYDDILNTYYNSIVINEIAENYLNGKISKNKFINQLSSATEIYLNE